MWWCATAKNRRQLYLLSAYVLGAMATLAKGPAGIALPGIVLVVWLVVAGRWRDIYRKLEIPRGIVLFIASGCPWYHAMLIRHGAPFWMEFIGDNYVHRAQGRACGRRHGIPRHLSQVPSVLLLPPVAPCHHCIRSRLHSRRDSLRILKPLCLSGCQWGACCGKSHDCLPDRPRTGVAMVIDRL